MGKLLLCAWLISCLGIADYADAMEKQTKAAAEISVADRYDSLMSAIEDGSLSKAEGILCKAKEAGQLEEILLSADDDGFTALMLAAVLNSDRIAAAILGAALNENINTIDMLFAADRTNKCTPLEWAIDRENPLAVIYMLIAARTQRGLEHVLLRTDSHGYTPLMQAVSTKNEQLVRGMLNVILDGSPDVIQKILFAPDGWGYFQLLAAIDASTSTNSAVFQMVFSAMNENSPRRVNEALLQQYNGRTLFDAAMLKKNYAVLETLVRAAPSNGVIADRLLKEAGKHLEVLLMMAVQKSDTVVINRLFDAITRNPCAMDRLPEDTVKNILKKKMTAGRYGGRTLFMYAIETWNFNITRLLLQKLESFDIEVIGEIVASQSYTSEEGSNESFLKSLRQKRKHLWGKDRYAQLVKWEGILQQAFLNCMDRADYARAAQLVKACKGVMRRMSCSPLHMAAHKFCGCIRDKESGKQKKADVILQLEELAEALIDDGCVFTELKDGIEKEETACRVLSDFADLEELSSEEKAQIKGMIMRLALRQLEKA